MSLKLDQLFSDNGLHIEHRFKPEATLSLDQRYISMFNYVIISYHMSSYYACGNVDGQHCHMLAKSYIYV